MTLGQREIKTPIIGFKEKNENDKAIYQSIWNVIKGKIRWIIVKTNTFIMKKEAITNELHILLNEWEEKNNKIYIPKEWRKTKTN